MSNRLTLIKNAVEKRNTETLDLLSTLVNINSYSYNKSGVEKVAATLRSRYEELGFEAQIIGREKVGDITLLMNKAAKEAGGKGGVLLNAHLDTVFNNAETPEIPFRRQNGTLRGHGVTDDKGGAVIIYQALRALEDVSLLNSIPVRVLYNTDEEEGSDYSRDLIEQETATAKMVLVAEYGKPRDKGATVVTKRLGRGKIDIELEGELKEIALLDIIEKAYYFGTPDESRVIRIRDYEKGRGGGTAGISFGFPDMEDGMKMKKQIEEMVQQNASRYGVKASLRSRISRPPLIFSKERWNAFEKVREIGKELGFRIHPEERTSCSDASFVPDNVVVLDGMGPIGDNVHTDEEFMTAETLIVRPVIMAELIASKFA